MSAHRLKRRISAFFQAIQLWLYIGLGVIALGALFFWLANIGPKRISDQSAVVSTDAEDPEITKASNEIADLEKRYRKAVDAELITTDAIDALSSAVEKQRDLLRKYAKAGLDQSTRLVRLESELDSVRAREKVLIVDRLEKDGEELLNADKIDQAGEKLRDALRLQNEINRSSASPRYKNFVRETSLTQSVAAVDAAPLRKEVDAAVLAARLAASEQRWSDSLAAYTAARDTQNRINREYGRTRFADLSGADRLTAEIESLNAAGIASEIALKEKLGDEAVAAKRFNEAAVYYADAGTMQIQVNKNFPRSRFVSSQRIEALEVKRQTALSSETADALEALDRRITEHLRKRQVVAAEQRLGDAARLVEKLFTEFPKSQRLDGTLKIKLAYLGLRRTDLRLLQDEVYERLLPLPGAVERLLLKTEVTQALYVLVMNTNPSRNPGRSLPVDSVNWTDAQEFCMRLSWMMGTEVRLPSIDEFRVAIGDVGTDFWSNQNSDGKSQEVGAKKANTDGFFDLVGNLAEWTASDEKGDKAIAVGGSYVDSPEVLAKVPRESRLKSDRSRQIGFRFIVETRR